ncbi:alanine racemase [Tessaracoccus sp. OS52]|uniref:alanine racemase n=1 Tax=Tessaracoccus sp. OS52 TaxID=2886691 RepID=UPI001D10E420|nr:alanine racemase [Tessaracoccus sp. OS52]MCC2594211.1 alanine racemase [Tessaracoccus sp. OS52]
MTLKLRVATEQWRRHQQSLLQEVPGLVSVAKGNGYGFGLEVCAREAMGLRAGTLAVGTAHEVLPVRLAGWTHDVVVLNPWRPTESLATSQLDDERVISTVSRVEDLDFIRENHPGARVILEMDTSMHRHGLPMSDLGRVDTSGLRFEGWTVHLPAHGSLEEAIALTHAATARQEGPVWVSHLTVADYATFAELARVETRMRVGTRLWLGAPEALTTTATVLDVHPIERGARLGYHQAKAPRDGFIVVASGGTAHGIALAAPVPQRSVRQRATTIADGLMRAAGSALSPFTIGGRKRPFAEPPHMHSSMLFVPGARPGVKVGDEVPVTCRMTTTRFDEILFD